MGLVVAVMVQVALSPGKICMGDGAAEHRLVRWDGNPPSRTRDSLERRPGAVFELMRDKLITFPRARWFLGMV